MIVNPEIKIIEGAFKAQDALNSRLSPDWARMGWRYYRAIFRESVEILDHLNWEWYKVPVVDAPPSDDQMHQIKLELCDMLHFGLSQLMIDYGRGYRDHFEEMAELFEDVFKTGTQRGNIRYKDLGGLVEEFSSITVSAKVFYVHDFASLCAKVDMSMTELLGYYYAKQTLNKFRWNNGYALPKDDPNKYVKMWPKQDGTKEEDNKVLMRLHLGLMDTIDYDMERLTNMLASSDYSDALYGKLAAEYPGNLLKSTP